MLALGNIIPISYKIFKSHNGGEENGKDFLSGRL